MTKVVEGGKDSAVEGFQNLFEVGHSDMVVVVVSY